MKVKGRDSANEIVEAQEVTDDRIKAEQTQREAEEQIKTEHTQEVTDHRMETHKTQNVTDKTTEIKETEEEAGEKMDTAITRSNRSKFSNWRTARENN